MAPYIKDWRYEWNNPASYSEGPIRHASGPMSKQEFMGRCEYLFGGEWRSELAKRFGYSDRQIRRWVDEPEKIPGPAIAAIRALWQCKRYSLEIDDLTEKTEAVDEGDAV